MSKSDKSDQSAKIRPVIYQILPRLFTNRCENLATNGTIEQNGCGKLNDIDSRILSSVKNLGATHIWYTGIIEHAHQTDYSTYGIEKDNPHIVKGKAGSPYAISDYYDIDPDLAVDIPSRMAEFESLVERTHNAGLKVIIDFVPNHVARRYHSDCCPPGVEDFGSRDNTDMFFSPQNNYYYIPRQQWSPSIPLGEGEERYTEFPARATGNDCFSAYPSACDWYETVKLNYGYDPGDGSCHFNPIPDTWYKMLNIMRFWAAKKIDALRCDMVHMVPVEFWAWAIPQVKKDYPHILFIAEIYDVSLYRSYIYHGHFDYLYDKVTLYDTLRGIDCHGTSAARLTSCWQTVEGISDNMLNFIENHDEQRYASLQYAGNAKKAIAAMAACCTINKGAVMVYMGQELGEPAKDAEGFSGLDGRTTIFDYWSLDTLRRWLSDCTASLKGLTKGEKVLRKKYAVLLNAVNKYVSLREGRFFDLMYVNMHSPGIDPHRQFAYLRECGGEIAIICLNFDSHDKKMSVNIPKHAFDVLGLNEGRFAGHEIISDKKIVRAFDQLNTFEVETLAHSASIIIGHVTPDTGK